jgi:hypothetical protein
VHHEQALFHQSLVVIDFGRKKQRERERESPSERTVNIHPPSRNDHPFARDHLRIDTDCHARCDTVHHVGVAALSEGDDAVGGYADVGLCIRRERGKREWEGEAAVTGEWVNERENGGEKAEEKRLRKALRTRKSEGKKGERTL